jgi:hypothetical protein
MFDDDPVLAAFARDLERAGASTPPPAVGPALASVLDGSAPIATYPEVVVPAERAVHRSHRTRLRWAVGLAALGLGFGSLGVAGALPDPVQEQVSDLADHVGVHLPDGNDDEPAPPAPTTTTTVPTTTTIDHTPTTPTTATTPTVVGTAGENGTTTTTVDDHGNGNGRGDDNSGHGGPGDQDDNGQGNDDRDDDEVGADDNSGHGSSGDVEDKADRSGRDAVAGDDRSGRDGGDDDEATTTP